MQWKVNEESKVIYTKFSGTRKDKEVNRPQTEDRKMGGWLDRRI